MMIYQAILSLAYIGLLVFKTSTSFLTNTYSYTQYTYCLHPDLFLTHTHHTHLPYYPYTHSYTPSLQSLHTPLTLLTHISKSIASELKVKESKKAPMKHSN